MWMQHCLDQECTKVLEVNQTTRRLCKLAISSKEEGTERITLVLLDIKEGVGRTNVLRKIGKRLRLEIQISGIEPRVLDVSRKTDRSTENES